MKFNIHSVGGVKIQKAFMLLVVDSGHEEKIAKVLRGLSVVERVSISYGAYDLIVEVNAPKLEDLKNVVIEQIRSIDHVSKSLTLIQQ
jgi:DNA-binding Lrp family transcriptional regulator